MSEIKAIQTSYKGWNFRSRLEARWAVFFEAMGYEFWYEPEGFQLPHGWYLPDFFLPKHNLWCEVKPNRFSVEDLSHIVDMADYGKKIVMLDGPPDFHGYVYLDQIGDSVMPQTIWFIKYKTSEALWDSFMGGNFTNDFKPHLNNINREEKYGQCYTTAIYKSRAARFGAHE